jgi:hypothetical protein
MIPTMSNPALILIFNRRDILRKNTIFQWPVVTKFTASELSKKALTAMYERIDQPGEPDAIGASTIIQKAVVIVEHHTL